MALLVRILRLVRILPVRVMRLVRILPVRVMRLVRILVLRTCERERGQRQWMQTPVCSS